MGPLTNTDEGSFRWNGRGHRPGVTSVVTEGGLVTCSLDPSWNGELMLLVTNVRGGPQDSCPEGSRREGLGGHVFLNISLDPERVGSNGGNRRLIRRTPDLNPGEFEGDGGFDRSWMYVVDVRILDRTG